MKPFRQTFLWALIGALSLWSVPLAYAQEALSVTVTPPLFQLTIGPGEFWSSSVKIVNSNPFDVTYYAQAVDFSAEGEVGQSKFVPILDDAGERERSTYSLGSWIDISPEPIVVKKGMSREVPFTVRIPEHAEPGGHYAAILVGTQPPTDRADGPVVKVSSYVSSLLLVRVKGEIVEKGRIREFISSKTWYDAADVHLSLRFENMGNAHVRPQGEVTIYNMWGKERGHLPINKEQGFGQVLPKSIRKFDFAWTGDGTAFDIGRYSAVATLAFGQEAKQNVSAVTYFWVVPTVPVATTVGGFLVIVITLTWFIRRYVRRALMLERERLGLSATPVASPPIHNKVALLVEPLREGVVDLRKVRGGVSSGSSAVVSERMGFLEFVRKYALFFLFVAVVVAASIVTSWFVGEARKADHAFEMQVEAGPEEEL